MEYKLELSLFFVFVVSLGFLTAAYNPDFNSLNLIVGRASSSESSEATVTVPTYINTAINRTPVDFTNGTTTQYPGYEYNATANEGWPLEVIILTETNVKSNTSYRADYNTTGMGGLFCRAKICATNGGTVFDDYFNVSNMSYNTSAFINFTNQATQQYYPHHVWGFANRAYTGQDLVSDFNQSSPVNKVVYNATCPCGDPVNYSQYMWFQLNVPDGLTSGTYNTTIFLTVNEMP